MHCSDDLPCFWQEIIFDWSITLAFVLGEGWGGGENQGESGTVWCRKIHVIFGWPVVKTEICEKNLFMQVFLQGFVHLGRVQWQFAWLPDLIWFLLRNSLIIAPYFQDLVFYVFWRQLRMRLDAQYVFLELNNLVLTRARPCQASRSLGKFGNAIAVHFQEAGLAIVA